MNIQQAPIGVKTNGAPTAALENLAPVLVAVLRCDGYDATEIGQSARQLGADCVTIDDASAWLDTIAEERTPPDVVVIVGRAESILGSWLVRRVSQQTDAETILVAATGVEVEHAAGFMSQGASGLVLMPATSAALVAELNGAVSAAAATRGDRRRRADLRRCMQTITRGEAEVLQSLLDGAANKQIAQKLGIGLRTVELRRSKVMRKMNASSISQLILHVAEAGVDRVPPLLLGRKRAPRS
ncbi:MAG: LuxR C-terminal-related transcriptional regulator [Planctomycetota bacterium]